MLAAEVNVSHSTKVKILNHGGHGGHGGKPETRINISE